MPLHPSVVSAAFFSTGLISCAPNLLLFLFPNYGEAGHEDRGRALLSLGQALAVGGLLGDVFLHALPECFAGAVDAHHHDAHAHGGGEHHHGAGGDVGLRVILGFAAFLVLDLAVRSFEERGGGGHGHGHGHSPSKEKEGTRTKQDDAPPPVRWCLSSAVLLNLLGDALHNFTDGVAIGASFAATPLPAPDASWFSLVTSRGGLAAVAVLLHEVPHELGDFATLVRAGLTRNAAIRAQFLTALAAFLGTAFGLFADRLYAGLDHEVLVPFTAGGFLYLACVTILPDVLQTEASALLRLGQVGSVLLGVGFMYGVALLEELEAASGAPPHKHGHEHGHPAAEGPGHSEF